MPIELPIDAVIPALVDTIGRDGAVVLEAPAGAGKTTRVPPALLDIVEGEIIVLEPRRLAARLAARRVASERGERVGETIGYQVRFEKRVSKATRVRYVTEELFLHRLLADPELTGVGAVVLDEIHERHIASDIALGLLAARRSQRRDLAVVAMSATLEAEPIAAFLDCSIVRSEGRLFDIDIHHDDGTDDRPLEKRVASAVRLAESNGDDGAMLVFLPGAFEIRRAAESCEALAEASGRELVTLHGSLPPAEQDRALAPSQGRGKIILSTNVAETSITVPGVTTVIDSGLARVARHDPWSGLSALRVEPISAASAAQRAGRAGRTAPGRCFRLFGEHDLRTRRAHDAPEITRSDLAGVALRLLAAGLDLDAMRWLDRPPPTAIEAAHTLLERLGAIDSDRRVTALGAAMARVPAHPRQSRIAIEGARRGVRDDAATLAALIGERSLRRHSGGDRRAAIVASSDLLEDLELLEVGGRHEIHRNVASQVRRVARQLADSLPKQRVPAAEQDDVETALLISTMAGFPDRIARRRRDGEDTFLLCRGGSARLSPASVANASDLIVAVEAGDQHRGTRKTTIIGRASHVEIDWVLELFLDDIEEREAHEWNDDASRVERVYQMRFGELTLEETRRPASACREASAILAEVALRLGAAHFLDKRDAAALEAWRARVRFAATCRDHIRAVEDSEVDATLARLCEGRTRLAELGGGELLALLEARRASENATINRLAPAFVAIPGRRRVAVNYPPDQAPWIASRMQDFFGTSESPTIGGGHVPLVLHLLAPNQRAVQVTRDLGGFWSNHYPSLRKQLMRRYPRHGWPEDPVTSPPTRPGRIG